MPKFSPNPFDGRALTEASAEACIIPETSYLDLKGEEREYGREGVSAVKEGGKEKRQEGKKGDEGQWRRSIGVLGVQTPP